MNQIFYGKWLEITNHPLEQLVGFGVPGTKFKSQHAYIHAFFGMDGVMNSSQCFISSFECSIFRFKTLGFQAFTDILGHTNMVVDAETRETCRETAEYFFSEARFAAMSVGNASHSTMKSSGIRLDKSS